MPQSHRLKLPTELGKLDFKAAFKLDQSYSLQDKVLPLLQQHDELCDLLSQLALEIQQAVAVERDIDPKVRGLAAVVTECAMPAPCLLALAVLLGNSRLRKAIS